MVFAIIPFKKIPGARKEPLKLIQRENIQNIWEGSFELKNWYFAITSHQEFLFHTFSWRGVGNLSNEISLNLYFLFNFEGLKRRLLRDFLIKPKIYIRIWLMKKAHVSGIFSDHDVIKNVWGGSFMTENLAWIHYITKENSTSRSSGIMKEQSAQPLNFK